MIIMFCSALFTALHVWNKDWFCIMKFAVNVRYDYKQETYLHAKTKAITVPSIVGVQCVSTFVWFNCHRQ